MRNWIQKHSIGLTLALVVAVMVMIFCFSAQTGEQSGAMSGRVTTWILRLTVPGFEDMSAQEQDSLGDTVGLVIRKLGHFSEYALLGFCLMLHIRQIGKRTAVRLPWLWSWAVGTLYAVSDEFHQGFVAGRGPSVFDVMIDSLGVIAGVLVMLWALNNSQRRDRRPRRSAI